ncbi:thermosome subunit beta [Candidatus Nitrosarchaeum limnium]|jgi:thermosome|uniref:Thermosome, subunit n=1 Tax=Candidatus Nitrosarchaeum limnium BG20 TaxID=859192 RepID=S2EQC9_9ARCH|nr:thermosome subunit beta [Candidatus Nitrosarchaeum limnium]EPA04674.1 thermosome, subunit [Candidatus Nitrosarchaeum limnium BG20]
MTQVGTTSDGVPIILLKEGTKQSRGRDAQRNNIHAAKLIAEIIQTSLGPRGMDKMLVDSLGDITITNDGATILKEIDVQHPAAKMMVEVAKATDSEVGDGTTSAVVLAGALLEKAESLIDDEIHPVIIADGYKKASRKAIEFLSEIAIKVDPKDRKILEKIAHTSMQTKLVSLDATDLAKLAVSAALSVMEEKSGFFKVNLENIKVEKKTGGSVSDSELVSGIILDKEIVHSGMPRKIENAKIALVSEALEIKKTEFEAKLNISSPNQIKSFMEEESQILKEMVKSIKSINANVVLCQKGIDDIVQHYMSKEGILAVRRIKESDMSKLAKATGGRIVGNVNDLSNTDLGSAQNVEEKRVEEDNWVFVEGCKNPKAISILIRGGSQRVIDEADRSMHDALMVVKDVVENPKIVYGGGAPESFVALRLRDWAKSLSGREQLAVEKFADAMESIPLALARNAGMNPIDSITLLRSKQNAGEKFTGVDVINGIIADFEKLGVIEPLKVKEQVIKSATETANMILRIDSVVAVSRSMHPEPQQGMQSGGMGMY